MSLNISLLKNVVRQENGSITAQCPACAALGNDVRGQNHLIVYPDGRYGCVLHPRDGFGSEERKMHLRKIHQLVGMPFEDEMGGVGCVGGLNRNVRPRYVGKKVTAGCR